MLGGLSSSLGKTKGRGFLPRGLPLKIKISGLHLRISLLKNRKITWIALDGERTEEG